MVAVLFEICGTTALKLSNGLANLWAVILVIVCYTISFASLGLALKGIDVSVAYAIWSGLGITFITIIGLIFFNEELRLVKLLGIFMIMTGVLILNFFSE